MTDSFRIDAFLLPIMLIVLLPICCFPTHAQGGSLLPASMTYSLEQFGPVTTPAQADETLRKASADIIAKGGGVLIIPREAPASWQPENISQGSWRTPAPPAPATQWGNSPGVTILDNRNGTMKMLVPELTGAVYSRTLRMPEGQSCGHWGYFPLLTLQNNVVRGTTSYRDWLADDVKAGKDQRFYVRTIRGLFPGMFLNSGDYNHVQRLYVKALGYDQQKKAPYFVADTDFDIEAKGAIMHNKNHANLIYMTTNSNTENQTFDMFIDRHHYSQGDSYMYSARFNYMGDVHSTAGDENGVIYAAFSLSETNIFRGQVETFNAQSNELKYKAGTNAHTLATGRPLIDLNPQKWIIGGTVFIVRPGTWWDLDDQQVKNPVFEGKSYPSMLGKAEGSGNDELRMGGLIRFAPDAPVTAEVVGRYFAVDEKDECVPNTSYAPNANGVHRWYLIHRFTANPDGTKDITIIRNWWGAKPAGSPTLYNPDNYSEDGHRKPLKYIIAPGANVYDVARGMTPGSQNTNGALERIVKVAPGSHSGTALDFAAGDPIEQAIGPDPFKPIPFRAWCYDAVPGIFPSPIFDIANNGAVSRATVMTVAGSGTLEEVAKRADKKPPFENILTIDTACNNGITFGGDVANAALNFRQNRFRAQPIKWRYADGKQEATLTVSPTDGVMHFSGNGIAVSSGAVKVGGLSGTTTPAQNLRGINIPVPAGARAFSVKFPHPELDGDYAVFLELSWLTNRAIVNQTPDGFDLQFDTPPAAEGKLHWMLVR